MGNNSTLHHFSAHISFYKRDSVANNKLCFFLTANKSNICEHHSHIPSKIRNLNKAETSDEYNGSMYGANWTERTARQMEQVRFGVMMGGRRYKQ